VRCVGYDPITKREIPRSYVFFLEARVASLEADMIARGLPLKPVEAYDAAGPSLSAQKDAQGDAEKGHRRRMGKKIGGQPICWGRSHRKDSTSWYQTWHGRGSRSF
jgi:hypothetical protein